MGHVLRGEVKLEGHAEIGRHSSKKAAADYPNDEIWLAVKLDGRSDNTWISTKAALPEAVAQHGNVAAVRAVFCGGEGAAGNNGSAEHREIIRGDVHALHLLRMVAAGDIEPGPAEIIGRNLLKDAGLLTPDVELRYVRPGERSLRAGVPQLHQRL